MSNVVLVSVFCFDTSYWTQVRSRQVKSVDTLNIYTSTQSKLAADVYNPPTRSILNFACHLASSYALSHFQEKVLCFYCVRVGVFVENYLHSQTLHATWHTVVSINLLFVFVVITYLLSRGFIGFLLCRSKRSIRLWLSLIKKLYHPKQGSKIDTLLLNKVLDWTPF